MLLDELGIPRSPVLNIALQIRNFVLKLLVPCLGPSYLRLIGFFALSHPASMGPSYPMRNLQLILPNSDRVGWLDIWMTPCRSFLRLDVIRQVTFYAFVVAGDRAVHHIG